MAPYSSSTLIGKKHILDAFSVFFFFFFFFLKKFFLPHLCTRMLQSLNPPPLSITTTAFTVDKDQATGETQHMQRGYIIGIQEKGK